MTNCPCEDVTGPYPAAVFTPSEKAGPAEDVTSTAAGAVVPRVTKLCCEVVIATKGTPEICTRPDEAEMTVMFEVSWISPDEALTTVGLLLNVNVPDDTDTNCPAEEVTGPYPAVLVTSRATLANPDDAVMTVGLEESVNVPEVTLTKPDVIVTGPVAVTVGTLEYTIVRPCEVVAR